MSITIELPPDIERRAAAAAEARGLPLSDYVSRLIEQDAVFTPPPRMTHEEIEQLLDDLCADSEGLPVLPPEANSREWIYGDHD